MNDKGRTSVKEMPAGTLDVLHPGVETMGAAAALSALGRAQARAVSKPAGPRLAPRLSALRGKRLALFGNGKVNALEILTAVGKRLEARHGVAESKFWRKRHTSESGAAVIPGLMEWKPDLVLTALGD